MPKLLIILPNNRLGGAEIVSSHLANNLASRGWRVDVLFLSDSGVFPFWLSSSVRKLQLTAKSESLGVIFFLFFIIRYLVTEQKPDLIYTTHVHLNSLVGFLRKIGFFRSVKLVARESTNIFSRFKGKELQRFILFYRLGYGSHDLNICQTKTMRHELLQNINWLSAEKISVFANPVAEKCLISAKERAPFCLNSVTQNISVGPSPIVIGCVGRLIPIKGHDILIKAFAMLRSDDSISSKIRKNLLLCIVGDGPQKEYLTSLAASLKITSSCAFVGHVNKPYLMMRQFDIGVMCSFKEGFPNVLLEMMASRIPLIISTDCCDAIDSMPCLLRSRAGDVENHAQILKKALLMNEDNSSVYQGYVRRHHSARQFVDNVLSGAGL